MEAFRNNSLASLFLIAFLIVIIVDTTYAQDVTVVNMTPFCQSDETYQDSEPNLAVNPAAPLAIFASAFTPDPEGSPFAPIYLSVDGGYTWSLRSIVLSPAGVVFPPGITADITLRWSLTHTLHAGILRRPYDLLPVEFNEIVDNLPINGFILAAKPSRLSEVIRENLKFHGENFIRMEAAFGIKGAVEEGNASLELLSMQQISAYEYATFLDSHLDSMQILFSQLLSSQSSDDPFQIHKALEDLEGLVKSKDSNRVVSVHSIVLHRLDAFLTMLHKSKGDPADILQNVRWQKELYSKLPKLNVIVFSDTLVEKSQQFIVDYGERKVGNDDYPQLISDLLELIQKTAGVLKSENLGLEKDIVKMKRNLQSPTALQKAHRGYLLKLQKLMN